MAKTWILGLAIALACLLRGGECEISFTCDFERDTCGFTNQEGLSAQWVRREMNLAGREGNVMTAETNGTHIQMARMMTPYFDDIHEPVASCLSFELFTEGGGVKSVSVQQEREYGIVPIWLLLNSRSGWERTNVNVVADGSTRFFFEAVLDASVGNSTVAIDNTRLKLSKC